MTEGINMKEEICPACQCEGRTRRGRNLDIIYLVNGDISYLSQCYKHSVELYKTGQTNYLLKYHISLVPNSERIPINPATDYFIFNSFK